jgi:hypothetical protein
MKTLLFLFTILCPSLASAAQTTVGINIDFATPTTITKTQDGVLMVNSDQRYQIVNDTVIFE